MNAQRVVPDEIEARLNDGGPIARKDVEQWIAHGDLEVWSAVYGIATRAYRRVRPQWDLASAGEFLLDYYLRCITSPVEDSDSIHSDYEAAGEMVELLVSAWRLKPETSDFVNAIVKRVTQTYLAADEQTRHCIEAGFLEHALEVPEFRPLFDRWKHQSELVEGYRLSLEWGLAHERRIGDGRAHRRQ